jgi:hypothetical protein
MPDARPWRFARENRAPTEAMEKRNETLMAVFPVTPDDENALDRALSQM